MKQLLYVHDPLVEKTLLTVAEKSGAKSEAIRKYCETMAERHSNPGSLVPPEVILRILRDCFVGNFSTTVGSIGETQGAH